jgi:hypothetical protein
MMICRKALAFFLQNWAWMGLVFAAAFFVSWLLFAALWFYIAFEVSEMNIFSK